MTALTAVTVLEMDREVAEALMVLRNTRWARSEAVDRLSEHGGQRMTGWEFQGDDGEGQVQSEQHHGSYITYHASHITHHTIT